MGITRGEVYFVELGPTRGKELDRKRRPVVVASVDIINRRPLVVIVVPGTTRPPNHLPYRNEFAVDPADDNGLENPTLFQAFQVKALDHGRFDQPPVGKLSVQDMEGINDALKFCLGIS